MIVCIWQADGELYTCRAEWNALHWYTSEHTGGKMWKVFITRTFEGHVSIDTRVIFRVSKITTSI